jgi:hypothetical protein
MPNVNTHYVKYVPGRRRRQGSASSNLGEQPGSSNVVTGSSLQLWAPHQISWEDSRGSHSAGFAFWSVTGDADGSFVDQDSIPERQVHIGNSEVNAIAWYVERGVGEGRSGIIIDAFDVDRGKFRLDDFVIVGPDHSLTPNANEEGFVPTDSAENIEAYNRIPEVPFYDWKVMGSEVADPLEYNQTVNANAHSSAIAFAFYRLPVSNPTGLHTPGPIRFPVPIYIPPESWHQFETGMSLAADVNKFSKEFRSDILTLSAKMISSSSQSIIQGIMSMAEEDKKEPPKPPKLPTDILVKSAIKEKTLTTAFVSKKK